MKKRVAIYTRVSTDEQTTENQLRYLHLAAEKNEWVITHVFKDEGVSGAKPLFQREEGKLLKKVIEQGGIDVLAAWSIDRLGRSLTDLVHTLSGLESRNIGLYLDQQRIDTTTPGGRAMYQLLGVFAEFERSLIAERVKSGMQRARAAGKHLGRPPIGNDKRAMIITLRAQGVGIRRIATELKTGVGTVINTLKESNYSDSEAKRRLVGLL
jgi:DNA invertase Pin-like site-specific DNA recombinase